MENVTHDALYLLASFLAYLRVGGNGGNANMAKVLGDDEMVDAPSKE